MDCLLYSSLQSTEKRYGTISRYNFQYNPKEVLDGSYTEGLIKGDFFCGLNLGDFGGHFTIAPVWLQCTLLRFEIPS